MYDRALASYAEVYPVFLILYKNAELIEQVLFNIH